MNKNGIVKYMTITVTVLYLLIGSIGCFRIFFFNHVETAQQRTMYLANHLQTGFSETNEQLMKKNGNYKEWILRGLQVVDISRARWGGIIIKTKDFTIKDQGEDACLVITKDGSTYIFTDHMKRLESYDVSYDNSTSYASQKMVRKVKREWNAQLDQIGHRMNFQFNFTPWMDFIW